MSSPFAGYLQAVAYPAANDRAINNAVWLHANSSGTPVTRDGVIWGVVGSNCLPEFSSGWNTQVNGGYAIVSGYTVVVPSTQTVTHDVATATARRDLVIIRVRDEESGDASSSAVVEIVKGTTTADPTVPARSLVLAEVNITANAGALTSAMYVDRRVFTGAASVIAVKGASENPVVAPGTIMYDTVSGTLMAKNGNSTTSALQWGFVRAYGSNGTYKSGTAYDTLPSNTTFQKAVNNDFASLVANRVVLSKGGLYTICYSVLTFGSWIDLTVNHSSIIGLKWSGAEYHADMGNRPDGSISITNYFDSGTTIYPYLSMFLENGGTNTGNATMHITRWGGQ